MIGWEIPVTILGIGRLFYLYAVITRKCLEQKLFGEEYPYELEVMQVVEEVEKDVIAKLESSVETGRLANGLEIFSVTAVSDRKEARSNDIQDCDGKVGSHEVVVYSDMAVYGEEISIEDLVYGKMYLVNFTVDDATNGITTYYDYLMTMDRESKPLCLFLGYMGYDNRYSPRRLDDVVHTGIERKVVECMEGLDDYEAVFDFLLF